MAGKPRECERCGAALHCERPDQPLSQLDRDRPEWVCQCPVHGMLWRKSDAR